MTFSTKKSEFHPKGWGSESWFCNNEKYCGKLLFFNKGKRCSFHYHKIKDEHFFLKTGLMTLKVGLTDNIDEAQILTLKPGDVFHVPVGLRHQMIAEESSELFEFSTQHFNEDSIRIIKGD